MAERDRPTKAEIESWHNDPEAAYAEAERRIAEAQETGETTLELSLYGECPSFCV